MPHLLEEDLDHVLRNTEDVWPALRHQRVFLTGGTGFVGMWLLESFVRASERLSLEAEVVLLTRDPDRFRRTAPFLANHPAIRLLAGEAAAFSYPEGDFAFVIHAATERSFAPTPDEPAGTFERDVRATKHVLEFARRAETSRFLLTSSGAVYGKQPPELTHIPEDYAGAPATADLNSVYGQAKRVSEFLTRMYAQQFGFCGVVARLFAFSGPYLPLDINFAIGNFVRDALAGGPVKIAGDGTAYRSYLYGADMAIWLWKLLVNGQSARPYHVGSSAAMTIAELAEAVVANTERGIKVEIAKTPVPGALPSRYVPAVERVKEEFGLEPQISLEEGIRRMYRWHRMKR